MLRAFSLEREAILVLCCVDYISNFDHREISRLNERLARIGVIPVIFRRRRRLYRLIEACNVILRLQQRGPALVPPDYILRQSDALSTKCTLVLLAPVLR